MSTESENLAERRADLARRFMIDAWDRQNTDALDEITTPDYVDHNVANETSPIEGRAAMKDYMEGIWAAIPDLEKEVRHVVVGDGAVGDDCVAVHYLATGTHTEELKGYAPTEEQIEVPGVYLLRFEDGLIAEGWDTSDTLSFWRQLGATVA